jgi:hypothetical protein
MGPERFKVHKAITKEEGVYCKIINHNDDATLWQANVKLKVLLIDKNLNLILHAPIIGMVVTISLSLDCNLSFNWTEASIMAAKAAGKGLFIRS